MRSWSLFIPAKPKLRARERLSVARDRIKTTGRRSGPTFVALPHAVWDSANFRRLSARAVKLLVDIYGHYNGRNNGDFCATISIMRRRNWKSKQTLALALDELLHYGLIVCTRVGNAETKRAYLYGVTFQPIDECDNKLDMVPATAALGTWKETKPDWIEPDWYTRYKKNRKARPKKRPTRNPTHTTPDSDHVDATTSAESDPDYPGLRAKKRVSEQCH